MANPNWTKDELILALHFYKSHRESRYQQHSPEILNLADEISRVSVALGLSKEPGLRNNNSVYMKMMNFRARDPAVKAQGQRGLERGNKLEARLWKFFENRDTDLAHTADAIKASLRYDEFTDGLSETFDDPVMMEAEEGRILSRVHLARERNQSLVQRKKTMFVEQHGRLFCEACKFDFAKVYGKRGEGFIECHHRKPLLEYSQGEKTKMIDLVLLCANCHRMIHSQAPWLTVEDLGNLLGKTKGTQHTRAI